MELCTHWHRHASQRLGGGWGGAGKGGGGGEVDFLSKTSRAVKEEVLGLFNIDTVNGGAGGVILHPKVK